MASESASKSIKTLGGFELITKIGQGGMGTVFRARQISLDRDVALKILPPTIAQKDPVFVERFIREARTSAKLNHPNIVQGIEVGQDDATGLYYFAMEYIDGPSVKLLLKQQRVLPERRALEISLGVAEALICAHRAGIVHRDIKPDNILLTSRGETKLADLGLARQALDSILAESDVVKAGRGGKDDPFKGVSRRDSELTQTGSAVGTPSYMAPEQIRGDMDKIDARTDLYELGATMFHMLTGKAPYTGANSKVVMVMHLTSPTPEARSENSSVSEPVNKLIYKLMQKEPSKRPQSAEEVAKELDRILNGAPERVRRTSGKHVPVGERGTGKQQSITGKNAATEEASWRTTLGGQPVGAAGATTIKSSRQPSIKKNRTMLFAGIAVAVLSLAGIAFAYFGMGSRGKVEASQPQDNTASGPIAPKPTTPDPKAPPPKVASNDKVDNVVPSHPAPAENVSWPPFSKALAEVKAHPEDYSAGIKLFDEAEKGAPPALIPDIRHEKTTLEHARSMAFRPILDAAVKKAREFVADGKSDFAPALACFPESIVPPNLLCDQTREELSRARAEIETQATAHCDGLVELLDKELPACGENVGKLNALRLRITNAEKVYPLKAAQEKLAARATAVDQRIAQVNANHGRQQQALFCQNVDAAWTFARNGDFNQAVSALTKIRSTPELMERFSQKSDVLTLDLTMLQDLQHKACAGLQEKLDARQEITVHPLGGAVLSGKVIARDKNTFMIDDKTLGAQPIDGCKLDAWDALDFAGSKVDANERKHIVGVYYFWLGKPQKAYEQFALLQKEKAAEAGAATIYVDFMNARATEMMNKISDYYHEVHDNSALPPEEKKNKQAAANELYNRLKSEFSNTEAYNARKQKK